MKTNLNKEQINFYQENGFVIIDDFLNNEELKLWSYAVDEAVKLRGKIEMILIQSLNLNGKIVKIIMIVK